VARRTKPALDVRCLSGTVLVEAEMMSFDPIPQARVVRHAGQLVVPPPPPRQDPDAAPSYLRVALTYAVGLWPLTAVVLLLIGLVVVTSHLGAP